MLELPLQPTELRGSCGRERITCAEMRGLQCRGKFSRVQVVPQGRAQVQWHLPTACRSKLPRMRLTASVQSAIATAARAVLPPGSRVMLFGSRTDDSRRGGDIDRLVESPMAVDAVAELALCNRLAAHLYRRIGELRIDIVMARPGAADHRLVVAEARRHGIELVLPG